MVTQRTHHRFPFPLYTERLPSFTNNPQESAYNINDMPTSITHQLLAEEVYKALPEEIYAKIGSLQHYYLGAQGSDVCFAYHPILTAGNNLGQHAHTVKPIVFFRILREEADRDPFVRAYAYGYVTHYAADTVFHPYIFERMNGKDRLLSHHSLEHAFDGALLKKYRGKKISSFSLPKLRRTPLGGVFRVFKRYAKESGFAFELNEGAFERSVKTYLALSSVRMPLYRKGLAENAERLFEQAKERSLALCTDFYNGKLEKETFDRDFLTGEQKKNKKRQKR